MFLIALPPEVNKWWSSKGKAAAAYSSLGVKSQTSAYETFTQPYIIISFV